MYTVPFTLSNVFAGFGKGDGLLHNEGTHLCLEYQVKDGIVGVLKSDIKQLRIPIDHVDSVTLTKGWFGTKWGVKIVIQGNRMDAFQDFPSASQGRIELPIAAKNLEFAEELVYHFHQSDENPTEASRA
jgi:hypothetical protein